MAASRIGEGKQGFWRRWEIEKTLTDERKTGFFAGAVDTVSTCIVTSQGRTTPYKETILSGRGPVVGLWGGVDKENPFTPGNYVWSDKWQFWAHVTVLAEDLSRRCPRRSPHSLWGACQQPGSLR